MKKREIPKISPLIQEWHPTATLEEQRQYTLELRAYLAALYRIFLRLEREGHFACDSRESRTHDILESDNSPNI